MGYPMTWRRVIARNGLQEGDYQTAPMSWHSRVNIREQDDEMPALGKHRRERIEAYERQAKVLCGDLRRLESDALDEAAVCNAIHRLTGVAVDDVAAVLQAFMRGV